MIAAPPFASSLPQRAMRPEFPADNAGQSAQPTMPFAATLALQTARADADTARAAAIRPEIGGNARAFSASALLVETAVAFRTEAGSALAGIESTLQPATSAGPAGELPVHLTGAIEALLAHFLSPGASTSAPQTQPAGAGAGLPARPPVGRAGATAATFPERTASPALAEALAPHDAAAPEARSIHARPLSRAYHAPTGTFAVHWLPVDGNGIRVLVKLARLPADLRGELETRLHALCNAFGLTLHDLAVHEAGA